MTLPPSFIQFRDCSSAPKRQPPVRSSPCRTVLQKVRFRSNVAPSYQSASGIADDRARHRAPSQFRTFVRRAAKDRFPPILHKTDYAYFDNILIKIKNVKSSPPALLHLVEVQPVPRMASLTGPAERTFLDQVLQIAGRGCA